MARIPGVPTLDPVSKPMESPGEAGKVGASIAGLGEQATDSALTSIDFLTFQKKAQQRVDTLAAQNELNAAYVEMKTQLAQTQNSRDVPDVIAQGHKKLNDISAQWSKSPASVSIQMQADGLRPDMAEVGTMRQITLMGKEFNINVDHQSEVLSGTYAAARNAGDNDKADMAVGAFATTLQGGVTSGLMGSAEAEERLRNFKVAGQAMQARMAIESPSPDTNMKMVNELEQHPENFPDLNKEQISELVQKGTAAFETHTRQMEWAQSQLTVNTIAPSIIKGATDEQGAFHLDQALTAASHLTPKEEEIVTPYLHNHAALADAQLLGTLNKSQDQVQDAIAHNKFNEAYRIAGASRDSAEKAGLPWYSQQITRIDAARREAASQYRANYNFDYAMQKKQEEMASTNAANQLLPGVVSGAVTEQQLTQALGPGKLGYKNYLQLQHVAAEVAKDPDTKKALTVMGDALTPLPKDASPEMRVEDDNLRWNLFEAYQQGVSEKNLKGDDKTKYAMELVKPYVTKQVSDKLDQILGNTPVQPSLTDRMGSFVFGKNYKPGAQTTAAPKENDTKTNSAGDKLKFVGGKWQLQQ